MKDHRFQYYVPFGWLDQTYDQKWTGYPGVGADCASNYCEQGAPRGRPKDGLEYFKPLAHVLLVAGGWHRGAKASVTRFAGPVQAYLLDLKQREQDMALALLGIQKELVDQYAEAIGRVKSAYSQKILQIEAEQRAREVQTVYVKSPYVKSPYSQGDAKTTALLLVLGLGGLSYYLYSKRKK